jgi:hypothetical protein
MATYNTSSTLSAMFKEIYDNAAENLIPESVVIQKAVPFKAGDKELGDKFIVPVQLSHEHGVTYLGTNSGVSTLIDVNAAVYKEAQVDGYGMLLRAAISYSAAAKMSNSKKAFMKWSEMLVSNMVNSLAKRKEVAYLYGQTGLGTVSSNGGGGAITLTTASWASGIWAGMEGCELDCWASNLTTQRNTNATLVVSAVNLSTKVVTLTGNGTDLAAIAANDVFFFRGANAGSSVYNESPGLDKIITNSGTLYNISASTYSLWAGNSYSCGSASLTMAKVLAGSAICVERGLDEDAMLICSPKTFANLNSDLAALRQFDSSYKEEGKNGFSSIVYRHQAGDLKIVSSIYCKEGEAFLFPVAKAARIGSTDITFKMPGKSDTEIFLQIPDKSGYELRCFAEDAFFLYTPARAVKYTSIVNA